MRKGGGHKQTLKTWASFTEFKSQGEQSYRKFREVNCSPKTNATLLKSLYAKNLHAEQAKRLGDKTLDLLLKNVDVSIHMYTCMQLLQYFTLFFFKYTVERIKDTNFLPPSHCQASGNENFPISSF